MSRAACVRRVERHTTRASRTAVATVVAEMFLLTEEGAVEAVRVTPLVDEQGIVLALPLAERPLADRLVAAEQVVLACTDERMALRGWEPLAITGRIEVEADLEGDRFHDELLDQELRKYPPSRLLVDSLRDRRENWWYLPRLLCYLRPTAPPRELAGRSDPTTGVLAWNDADALTVETVEVTDADEDHLDVRALSGTTISGTASQALLFRHDYSQPDLERHAERHEAGVLTGATLHDVIRSGELVLPDPPRLLDRIRRFRQLSKACRRELAALR
jgi:hypothetical protein